STGILETMNGDSITIDKEIVLLENDIAFHMKDKNSWQNLIQKGVKLIRVGNKRFVCLPLKSNGKQLQLFEVLATNKNYFLAQYWYTWYNYYIFDKEGNIIENDIKVYNPAQSMGKGNNKKALEKVQEYFGNCPEVIEKMTKNLENRAVLCTGVENIQCGSGAISFDEIVTLANTKFWKK
ncbi:MAG: hypothetical protein ABUL44_01005, partial [Flavobacterium sp.]